LLELKTLLVTYLAKNAETESQMLLPKMGLKRDVIAKRMRPN
jgi:hypothetical protein